MLLALCFTSLFNKSLLSRQMAQLGSILLIDTFQLFMVLVFMPHAVLCMCVGTYLYTVYWQTK